MTQNGTLSESCDPTNLTLCKALESEWPLERVVSTVVPVFFGIIGLIGLMGNALVIVGKCGLWRNQYALGRMETAAPLPRWPTAMLMKCIFINHFCVCPFSCKRSRKTNDSLPDPAVVSANQQMRSTTNILIINLAIADILFVIFCVPFTATDYVLTEWPFGDLWCKFVSCNGFSAFDLWPLLMRWFACFVLMILALGNFAPQVQYMIVVTCHASVYTLVLMSFDRFLAVVHPVTSMSLRTERNATMWVWNPFRTATATAALACRAETIA